MKSNKYQSKMFVPSDHAKEERRWWTKLAVLAAVAALLFVGLGIAGSFEVSNYQVANGMEVSR